MLLGVRGHGQTDATRSMYSEMPTYQVVISRLLALPKFVTRYLGTVQYGKQRWSAGSLLTNKLSACKERDVRCPETCE